MKKLIFTTMLLLFASVTNAQDSILVCQGIRTYFLGSGDRTHQMNVVISKDTDGKISKVVIDNDPLQTFTLKKIDIQDLRNAKNRESDEKLRKLGVNIPESNTGHYPTYHQLITKDDLITLHMETPAHDNYPSSTSEHTIQHTGAYELNYFSNQVRGQCVARDKVF